MIRTLIFDYKCLPFDIYEDDLLDDSESVFMVDTWSSSHREKSTDIACRYSKLDRNATPDST